MGTRKRLGEHKVRTSPTALTALSTLAKVTTLTTLAKVNTLTTLAKVTVPPPLVALVTTKTATTISQDKNGMRVWWLSLDMWHALRQRAHRQPTLRLNWARRCGSNG